MTRHRPATISAILVAASGCLLSTQALGQTLNWTNTNGGAASLSGNWSPTAVPNSTHALVWNLNNTYGVTFNSFTTSSLSHTYKRGTVSLTASSPHNTGTFTVADLASEVAEARLINGTISASGVVVIGSSSTSIGTLEILGSGAVFTQTGGPLHVGFSGNGNLEILNGGTLNVTHEFFSGANSSSTSTITISGRDTNAQRALLNVLTTGDSRIGAGGDVSMLIDSGGTADFAGNLIVANGSASTSSITLQSPNLVVSALNVDGDLMLGRNVTGVAAGNGSLIVNSTARATILGTLHIGDDPEGGSGLLRLGGANADVEAHTVQLGSAGTIEFNAGVLTVNGGSLLVPNGHVLNLSPAAGGTNSRLRLTNGATHTATNTTAVSNVSNTFATLSISSGSTFHQSVGIMLIGGPVNSSGHVLMNEGTLTVTSQIRAGVSGFCELNLSGNSSVTCRDLDLAALAGSTAIGIVGDSTLTVTEDLVVGGASNGSGGFSNGGNATLRIDSGGILNTPTNRSAAVTGNGHLEINSGTANIGGSLFCAGDLTLNNGTLNAPFIECYGIVSAAGRINARFFSDSPITMTGPLTIGNTVTNSIDRITVDVGPHALSCVDPDVAVLANCSMNGGSIDATNSIRLFTGNTITGTGTIASDFENLGIVTSTTATGITFTEDVISTSGQLGGTRIHFAPGSTYTGRNITGGAKWHFDANTTATFNTNNSSIGDNSATGVILLGTLDVAAPLLLNDTGGLPLGPLTTLRNTTLTTLSNPVTIERTGNTRHIFRGTGTLNAVVNNSGTISPGLDEADRTGALAITGFYSQSVTGNTGELIMDLDGLTTFTHDILQLNGGGAVDGILRLRVGFTPFNGARIPIIFRGGTNTILTGTFDQLIAPVGWSLDYRADTIDAVFCAADYNADGISDFFDYLDFVADFSSGDPRADFNLDSVIDFFDYLDFVAAFSSGC